MTDETQSENKYRDKRVLYKYLRKGLYLSSLGLCTFLVARNPGLFSLLFFEALLVYSESDLPDNGENRDKSSEDCVTRDVPT